MSETVVFDINLLYIRNDRQLFGQLNTYNLFLTFLVWKEVFWKKKRKKKRKKAKLLQGWGVVGWCEDVYLTSSGRPTNIGLQLSKACYSCSR